MIERSVGTNCTSPVASPRSKLPGIISDSVSGVHDRASKIPYSAHGAANIFASDAAKSRASTSSSSRLARAARAHITTAPTVYAVAQHHAISSAPASARARLRRPVVVRPRRARRASTPSPRLGRVDAVVRARAFARTTPRDVALAALTARAFALDVARDADVVPRIDAAHSRLDASTIAPRRDATRCDAIRVSESRVRIACPNVRCRPTSNESDDLDRDDLDPREPIETRDFEMARATRAIDGTHCDAREPHDECPMIGLSRDGTRPTRAGGDGAATHRDTPRRTSARANERRAKRRERARETRERWRDARETRRGRRTTTGTRGGGDAREGDARRSGRRSRRWG